MTGTIESDLLDLDRLAAVRRGLRLDLNRWLTIGRRRPGRRRLGGDARRGQRHGRAVDEEAGSEPEALGAPAAVLEVDDVLLAADDGAHEPRAGVLHDEVLLGLDGGDGLLLRARVDEVVVRRTGRHPSTLGRPVRRPRDDAPGEGDPDTPEQTGCDAG